MRLIALRDGADSVCPRRTNCYVRRNAFCALTLPQSLQPASRLLREIVRPRCAALRRTVRCSAKSEPQARRGDATLGVQGRRRHCFTRCLPRQNRTMPLPNFPPLFEIKVTTARRRLHVAPRHQTSPAVRLMAAITISVLTSSCDDDDDDGGGGRPSCGAFPSSRLASGPSFPARSQERRGQAKRRP